MAAYGRQPPKAIDPSKEWYLMFKAQSGTGTPNTKLWVDEVSYLNYTPPVPLLTINITWYNPIAANYSPINMTTNNGLVFNFSVAENYSDTSCELYQNGLINSTVSNVFNATVYNIVLNYSTSQNYNYSWYCYNATGAVNGSTFNRSIIINIPPDTCTCAGLNNAWEIDNSDGCNITEGCNLGTGKLNFTGTGTTTCNTTINTTDLGDPGATGVLQINSACKIDVY